MIKMKKAEMSKVVKNSLFAMVDLFLDYVYQEEEVGSQKENISEFIIDCHNLETNDFEYKLLQSKFVEEFENDSRFYNLEAKEITKMMEVAIYRLIKGKDVPFLILDAVNEYNS